MDIGSISSQFMLQEQIDMLDQQIQQTIVVQQDATLNNNNTQAQLDAFATSTIQPSNS